MKKFYYKIYGLIVNSNVELSLLCKIDNIKNNIKSDLELFVKYEKIHNNGIYVHCDESGE